MATAGGGKQLGGTIDADVKDALKKQVTERGQVQGRAIAAALRIWLLLPEDLQATFIASPPKTFEDYIRVIRNRTLPEALAALTEKQRRDLWALLVEAHGRPGKKGRGKTPKSPAT